MTWCWQWAYLGTERDDQGRKAGLFAGKRRDITLILDGSGPVGTEYRQVLHIYGTKGILGSSPSRETHG